MRTPLHGLLLVLSLAFLFGALVFLYSVWPKTRFSSSPLPANPPASSVNGEEATSYKGSLLGEEDLLGVPVRRMINEQGQVVAFLQSGQIDLRILQPNLKISVEGRISKILDGNRPLVLVDKLSFR